MFFILHVQIALLILVAQLLDGAEGLEVLGEGAAGNGIGNHQDVAIFGGFHPGGQLAGIVGDGLNYHGDIEVLLVELAIRAA